jgi:hypothetical protein
MMNASDVMMTDENIKGHFGSVLAKVNAAVLTKSL